MADPHRHDQAVVLTCDRKFFAFALFMVRQIDFLNPRRAFDLVIATRDDLTIPDWAAPLGIVLHRSGDLPDWLDRSLFPGSLYPLYRLALARELGDRYRRILYLDSDMFVEGGDLNRLFAVDLGPHAVGMVLDAPFFENPSHHPEEFRRAGLPAMPYANSGLQLIDTRAYVAQDIEQRCLTVTRTHPHAITLTDQSLVNLALRGRFATLAPCWNWQVNSRYPLVPMRYPVFIRHFIGKPKPDQTSARQFDVRFNAAYRAFCEALMPESLASLAPLGDPSPMPLGEVLRLVLRHLSARDSFRALIARHDDPYRAIL